MEAAAIGPYPEHTPAVYPDFGNSVDRQAVRVPRNRAVDFNPAAVVFIQTVLGAEPHKPFTVLHYTLYNTLGQSFFQ